MPQLPLGIAAACAKVPESTLRRWLSEGRLVKHGDRKPYRVEMDEVDQLTETFKRNS